MEELLRKNKKSESIPGGNLKKTEDISAAITENFSKKFLDEVLKDCHVFTMIEFR